MWVLDPHTSQVYAAKALADGPREVKSGVPRTENPGIELPLDPIFADVAHALMRAV